MGSQATTYVVTIDDISRTINACISLISFTYFQAVSSLLRMIAEDWVAVKTYTERNVMIRRAQTGRSLMIIGYVMMGSAATIAVIIPSFGPSFRQISNLTDGDRPLPLQTYYFYDTDKSPQFEFTLFCQVALIVLGSLTYIGMDTLFAVAILHICGQLENFGRQLSSLNFQRNFDIALRNNVQTHLRLIRCSLADLFNPMQINFFMQIYNDINKSCLHT